MEQNLSDDSDQDRGTMAVKLGDDRIKKESKNVGKHKLAKKGNYIFKWNVLS